MPLELETYFGCKIELIFSKRRKTLSIQINPNGIKVRSSYWTSENEIKKFLIQNESWIRKKLNEQKSKIKLKLNIIDNEKNSFKWRRLLFENKLTFNSKTRT